MRKPSVAVVGGGHSSVEDTKGMYLLAESLEGYQYLWDPYFIHLVRYALSTFCISEMSSAQREFFQLYVDAVNQVIAFNPATRSLDAHLADITQCVDRSSNIIACGNAVLHTYVPCGVDINL